MPAYKKAIVKVTNITSKSTVLPLDDRKALMQRSQNCTQQIQDQNKDVILTRAKRRRSPVTINNEKNKIKRSALGNVTNNLRSKNNDRKENISISTIKDKNVVPLSKKTTILSSINVLKPNNENIMKPPLNDGIFKPKILTRAAVKNAAANVGIIGTNSGISNTNNSSVAVLSSESKKCTSDTSKVATAVSQLSSSIAKVQELKIAGSTAKMKEKNNIKEDVNVKPTTRRISNEFEKTEDSLYMSALDDMPSSDSLRLSGNFESNNKRRSKSLAATTTKSTITTATTKNTTNCNGTTVTNGVVPKIKSLTDVSNMSIDHIDSDCSNVDNVNRILTPSPIKRPKRSVPEGVHNFDEENLHDQFQVSEYAMDIFEYLKKREALFRIEDYMDKQICLSKWMRSLLVDWMVEVQETFELNHETLYLAVKLVDLYLCKEIVLKDKLQLLGAGALLIACKFDERSPPTIDDFLYICDGAYVREELIAIEIKILKIVNFDLGIPLSYRFLRRYARCAKVPMPILTLARYILEFSLMDYTTISYSDSKIACAVLFMALRITGTEKPWTKTLEFYSGYKLEDFAFMIPILNNGLRRKPRETIKTIRNKYSHKIFFEVAKIPLMSNEKLFENHEFIKKQLDEPKD